MQSFDHQRAGAFARIHAQRDDGFHQLIGLIVRNLLRHILQGDGFGHGSRKNFPGEMHRRIADLLRDRLGEAHVDTLALQGAHDPQCHGGEPDSLPDGNNQKRLREILTHVCNLLSE